MCDRSDNFYYECFNWEVGRQNMICEVTRFLKICVSKTFSKNFQALVFIRALYCYKYSSEFLYSRNITIFGIFTKSNILKFTKATIGRCYIKNRSSLAFWALAVLRRAGSMTYWIQSTVFSRPFGGGGLGGIGHCPRPHAFGS